ncbi:hypothetical protein B1756_17965 [Natrarchaeobaculum aegyptiacum]|uniref:Uncharacterized protein n=1 Tax=Natrarchaeobaculum aegyptiacum TaxID=745377 RepID=A0A2Z2HVU2_9EURY|nr:hypothetical protein B1756_17965 [Natrarchaeobaculum aegyptiacum]
MIALVAEFVDQPTSNRFGSSDCRREFESGYLIPGSGVTARWEVTPNQLADGAPNRTGTSPLSTTDGIETRTRTRARTVDSRESIPGVATTNRAVDHDAGSSARPDSPSLA